MTRPTPPRAPRRREDSERLLASLVASARSPPTRVERWAESLGRWQTLAVLLAVVVAWGAYNLAAPHLGAPRFEAPPFFWAHRASMSAALLMLGVIAAGGRARHRRDALTRRLLSRLLDPTREPR